MEWIEKDNLLYKKFTFKDFISAFGFISKVALAAEKVNHHPTWTNTYNTVEIKLSTHSAGNKVTNKDYSLAKEIDQLADSSKAG